MYLFYISTDTFHLSPVSQAFSYQWLASAGEVVSPVKYPLVQSQATTRYFVLANLGKCQARDSVLITVAPYPNASAGPDQTIYYGTRVSLFTWLPPPPIPNRGF